MPRKSKARLVEPAYEQAEAPVFARPLGRPLREPYASAVADILLTAEKLRDASVIAVDARAAANRQGSVMTDAENADAAEAWVKELTARIRARADRDGLPIDMVLAFANQILDGRLRLPDGIEPTESM